MDDEEEEEDDEVMPLKGINQPGKQPEAGIISKVYVENFM